jgi:hypothetical protein
LVLLLKFSHKLPKVNSHPVGGNSPNLVTLSPSSSFERTPRRGCVNSSTDNSSTAALTYVLPTKL